MQVTYIVKNLTESMLTRLDPEKPYDAWAQLVKWAFGDLRHCVTQKCGTGSFGDRVSVNSLIKANCAMQFKIEPRRGYNLITFTLG
jgi:hypothetical protein